MTDLGHGKDIKFVKTIDPSTPMEYSSAPTINSNNQLSTKSYVDSHTSNNIWTRASSEITVTNSGDSINLTTSGKLIQSNTSVVSVVAATGLTTINKSIVPVESSTAAETIVNANPAISAGTNFQVLNIIGTSDTKIVTFRDGNGLKLKRGYEARLKSGSVLTLVYYNSLWNEISRSNEIIFITTVPIVAATGLAYVGAEVIPIESSTAGNTTVTANPAIAAGIDGQILTLIGRDDVKTVTFNTGNGLALTGGSSIVLGFQDTLQLVYYNNLWNEISRSINSTT